MELIAAAYHFGVKKMRTTTGWTLLLCSAVCLMRCTDQKGSSCPDGDEGCKCYPNDTCNDGLMCVDGLCVGVTPEGEKDAAGETVRTDAAAEPGDGSGAGVPSIGSDAGAGAAGDASAEAPGDASAGPAGDANTAGGKDATTGADAAGSQADDGGLPSTAGSDGSPSGNGGTQSSGGSGGTGHIESTRFAMYIVVDSSNSMMMPDPYIIVTDPTSMATKWQVAVDGISSFVTDDDSIGIDVALQYFPPEMDDCTGTAYMTPEVPMERLPGNAGAITESLAIPEINSDAGTPLESALRGITSFCSTFQNDPAVNPSAEACVPVLITDGMPTECSVDASVLVGIVADSYTEHGIKTYVIGMWGADFDLIEMLNQQGGTDCTVEPDRCQLGSSMTVLEALEMIRDSM